MKVMVTGATGFIGRHLVALLLEDRHEVVAVARKAESAKALGWTGDVSFIPGDIAEEKTCERTLAHAPQVLIHLAWTGLQNYRSPLHYERTLFDHYHFLKRHLDAGLAQLLVSGTCLEYGLRNGCLDENMSSVPVTAYAIAKDTLRRLLADGQSSRPFTLQWARLFYLRGEGQHESSLLPRLEAAVRRGATTFDMSGGEQLRDFLPVREAARKLSILAKHDGCQGIINICSGKPISVRRLAEERLAELGSKCVLNFGALPYPDYEPMAFWGNSSKYEHACAGN